MPTYYFSSDVLLPYIRETDRDRKPRTRERETQIVRLLLDFFGPRRLELEPGPSHILGSTVREY